MQKQSFNLPNNQLSIMKQFKPRYVVAIFAILCSLFAITVKAQFINIVAGNGSNGFSGDGGKALAAELDQPAGVTVDTAGNIYIADYDNNRIRKVTNGIITTVAGGGKSGLGDGGLATSAELGGPAGVTVDASGNIYIAEQVNNRIRKVTPNGIITTVAGGGNIPVFSGLGDGGLATSAVLSDPTGVAVDASGNIYIDDFLNNRIRKVDTNGIINTIAGGGTSGALGDGGLATSAELSDPLGIAIDSNGNIYIADAGNYRIRKVDTNGIISTVAGNGTQGYSGDNSAAIAAELSYVESVAVDALGNIYIGDGGNSVVRKVDTKGIITTVAGNGIAGVSGDGDIATNAELVDPQSVALNSVGDIYIADRTSDLIRKVIVNEGVKITSFTAKDTLNNREAIIKWVTSSEINIKDFTIQRSTDSVNYSSIASVLAHGGGANYEFVDNNSLTQDTYRLIIVYTDGAYSYFYPTSSLPVSLYSFTAVANNKAIETNWHTATELNTSHFTVQHSTDGSSFTDIGTVKAIGSGANSYSFTDNKPANGINYYRLESVDKDGASTYSKVVSCEWLVVSKQLTVYPNPAKSFVTISGSHIASVQVVDNIGRVVKIVSLKDATNPTLSVSGLPGGVYHLRVQTTDGNVSGVGMVKE